MQLEKKISNAELEVMKILWREKKAVPFTDIRLELQTSKGWEKSTINTLIRRLVEKKAIIAEKRDIIYYVPNVHESEYIQSEEQSMLDRLYEGSAKKFIVALCHRGQLKEKDIDELKAFFKLEGERNE